MPIIRSESQNTIDNRKSLGTTIILGGIAATISGAVCACMINTKSVKGFLRATDNNYAKLVDKMFAIGNFFIVYAVIGIVSIIAGIIIKKTNTIKIERQTEKKLLIVVPLLVLLLALVLMIPYIKVAAY